MLLQLGFSTKCATILLQLGFSTKCAIIEWLWSPVQAYRGLLFFFCESCIPSVKHAQNPSYAHNPMCAKATKALCAVLLPKEHHALKLTLRHHTFLDLSTTDTDTQHVLLVSSAMH